ncbi:MAG TPA: mechanosensitive ion channel family protein [Candidatus Paceibacterota bacterium]|nr:mechanosensitive ion channel family protein [Candidatus Paceibacterota bacterium]
MLFNQYITNPYIRALIIGGGLLLLIILITKILSRIIRIKNKKKEYYQKSKLRRFILPIMILIFMFIIQVSINELSTVLTEFSSTVNKLIYSISFITINYLLFITLDLFVLNWWKRITEKTNTSIDDNLMSILHGIIQISLIGISIIFILHIWGIEVGPILAGLGIAGLAVALALQPTLDNIFSGISIVMDKTIKEGDLVYIDNKEARIIKIGLRSTKIRTSNEETIIIPNNKIANNQITNASLPEPIIRIVIPFNVGYGSEIEKVKKIVIKELISIKGSLKTHQPFVRFMEMDESYLKFKGYFYINFSHLKNKSDAIDEANTKIYNALIQNNIQIPFPQLDVHFKNKI